MDKCFGQDYNGKFSPMGYLGPRYGTLDRKWIQFHLDNGFKFLGHRELKQGPKRFYEPTSNSSRAQILQEFGHLGVGWVMSKSFYGQLLL